MDNNKKETSKKWSSQRDGFKRADAKFPQKKHC